ACHNFQITLMENISVAAGFVLVGLTDAPELQVPLFVTFTIIYLITLVGNLGMLGLILLDSRLHTPMYIFLSNLSFVDCVYASAVTPKVIEGFLTGDKIISYNACAAQMFFFSAFAINEFFILASMAFDRHAAVCKPLHYSTTMTTTMCALLVSGSYMTGIFQSSILVYFTFHLTFCDSNVVHHFFCDIPALLTLSCSDIYNNEIVLFILAAFNVAFTLLVIVTSYILIFIAILRMSSAKGRKKAISTCASHLTTVSIYYGTTIFMYLQPSSSHSMDTDKMASVFYTMEVVLCPYLCGHLSNFELCLYKNKREGDKDVIKCLFVALAFMGMPEHIKTENGPSYTSRAFKDFCERFQLIYTVYYIDRLLNLTVSSRFSNFVEYRFFEV
ncbi:hypothetical protein STEG23_031224, partial [Scotinomys teguina]